MDILLAILAVVLSLLGIVGNILPGLPGSLFSYAGLLCAWAASWSGISGTALVLWLVVTIVVSAVDYFLPAWMTKRFGGSRAGAIGATIGVFAGFLLPLPFVGIIIGPFVGAVVGEMLHDNSDTERALKVGIGSFLSFIVGTGIKLIASVWMMWVVLADIFPAVKDWFVTIF